jgi:GntR family transcriptional regulator
VTYVSRYAAPDGHRQDGVDKGPKYKRVASAIEEDIRSGELAPGMRLLPERQLAVEFGVSYGTVRHAAEILRDKGLIQTRHGEGTFVTRPGERPDSDGDSDSHDPDSDSPETPDSDATPAEDESD